MSKKAKIILIIVGVLIIAGVGYYFYNKKKKEKTADANFKKAVDAKDPKAIEAAVVAHPQITGVAETAVLDLNNTPRS